MRRKELRGRKIVVGSVVAGLMVGLIGVPSRGRASGPGVAGASASAGSEPAGGPAAFDPNTDPNLVAWWKLDGDATDSSGHGLAGRPQGGPQWVPGRIGGAVQLDGVDDYIDCGAAPALGLRGALTVACWVKVGSFHRTWETILAKGDGSYRLSRFRDTSRGVHFACTGTEPYPPWLNAVATLADARWHHVAGVYDGSSLILYVDGREVAQKEAGGPVGVSEHPLYLGGNAESGGRWLGGLLDDVRLYNRGLSVSEVAALVGPVVGASGPGVGAGAGDAAGGPRPPGLLGVVVLLGLLGVVVLLALVVVRGRRSPEAGPGAEPGMVWKIARKEFLLNVMTFKFAVATVACLVLAAVFTPILAKDYQRRLQDCHANVAANEAELQKVIVYQNITPTVYRPPNVLSIFGEGLEKRLGQSARIETGSVPATETATAGNPFLSIFPALDVMLIVKVVMAVLALLIAYDAISGEREQGTLKLILANPAARAQVLLGKLLAGLMTLLIPVTVAFILTLLILQFFPLIHLSGADWVRVGLMYLASLVFISTMYNISLLFSCLTHRSNVSLVAVLLAWVVFAAAIPSASAYLSNHLRPTGAREEVDTHISMLEEECALKISDLQQGFDEPPYAWCFTAGAFGERSAYLCDRRTMDYFGKVYSSSVPLKINCANRVFEVQQRYLRESIKRKRLTDLIAWLSPIALYENVVLSLAGTDLWGHEHFRMEVKAYADDLAAYIRSRTENFSAPCYFVAPGEEGYVDLLEVLKRFQTLYGDGYVVALDRFCEQEEKQVPRLDLRDLPRFTYRSQDLARTVQAAAGGAVLLLLIDGLVFLLTFVAFQIYDVR